MKNCFHIKNLSITGAALIAVVITAVLTAFFCAGKAVHADAQDVVVTINGTGYTSLREAVEAAQNGDTLLVVRDCEVNEQLLINKSIVIKGASDGIVISRDPEVYKGCMITQPKAAGLELVLENITIDGGAKWDNNTVSAEAARTRTDSSPVCEDSLIRSLSVLRLKNSVIQNCHSIPKDDYGGPALRYGYDAEFCMTEGSAIINCTAASCDLNNSGAIGGWGANVVIEDSVIEGCASFGVKGGAGASAIFHREDGDGRTVTLGKGASIRCNYDERFSAVTMRGGVLDMRENSEVRDNIVGYGAILIYTRAELHMYDKSAVSGNIGKTRGGGVFISGNINHPASGSKMYMHDEASVCGNTGVIGGGICNTYGVFCMLDSSSVRENKAERGGAIYLNAHNDHFNYISLLGGSISGNSIIGGGPESGESIYAKTAGLYLNPNGCDLEGIIHLHEKTEGEGHIGMIHLLGDPGNRKYMIHTAHNDRLAGRDLVIPSSMEYNGVTYSIEDASLYADNFDHVDEIVDKGSMYYGRTDDRSHDKNLVIVYPEIKISKTVDGTHKDRRFGFILQLDDRSVNGRYGNIEFINGRAEFELADGESAFTYGMDEKTRFTVTELPSEGFTASVNDIETNRFEGTTQKDTADHNRPAHAHYINYEDTVDTCELTFDPAGGKWENGSADPIVEIFEKGARIHLPKAPVRDGYRMKFWKGSEYQPGQEYTVTEDHTFAAEWERIPDEDRAEPASGGAAAENNSSSGDKDDANDNKADKQKDKDRNDSTGAGREGSSAAGGEVKTGDEGSFMTSAVALLFSCMALAWVLIRRKAGR